MTVKLIIAVDQDNAIGWENGKLPWHLSADLKRFKELTTGKTILMGRTTFDSLNRPAGLPNRRNVVLTRNLELHSKDQAANPLFFGGPKPLSTFVQVHQACLGCTPTDLWIVGGERVYTQAILFQLVDEIYLTRVALSSGADVKLPFDLYNWERFISWQAEVGVKWILRELIGEQSEQDFSFSYITLERV